MTATFSRRSIAYNQYLFLFFGKNLLQAPNRIVVIGENSSVEMLEFVKIANLALMDRETVEFSDGFTAVTGETGAGKSVLLGALAILAGNRVGKEVIGKYGDSCTVEGQISFPRADIIEAFLEENALPPCEDGAVVISRSIHRQKTARILINGALTTLSVLAKMGRLWVDFHGANEPQKLFSEKNQLSMLDAYAHNFNERQKYLDVYDKYRQRLKNIELLRNSKKLSADEIEFLKKRISEIQRLNPTQESIAELEEKSKIAEMSSQIVEGAWQISSLLLSDEGASSMVAQALRAADALSGVSPQAKGLAERIRATSIEMADIAQEYEALARSCNMTPAQIEQVRSDMSAWLSLERKYGAGVEKVLEAKREMETKVASQSDVKAAIDRLSFEAQKLLKELAPLSEAVLQSRKNAAQKLSRSVVESLLKLGFKKPRFEIILERDDEPTADCQSRCSFRFSANAGHDVAELAKIASSGELARVMLALKTALAKQDDTQVLVFDEVDSNVGGEVGSEVGAQLLALSKNRQVFCVTHLPQVAARADHHFVVTKTQTDTSTSVKITSIDSSHTARVSELARMLGDRNSKTALMMAEKLLQG